MIPVRGEWLECPTCGMQKLLRVAPDTEATALPVFCKRCHNELKINIRQSQSQSQSQEPEPEPEPE